MNRFPCVVLAALACVCGAAARPVDLTLGSGDVLRVEAVSPGIFRVRLSASGRFEPSLMERYGIVRTDWPAQEAAVREEGGVARISTAEATVAVRLQDGRMQLLDPQGKAVCEEILPQKTRWTAPELQAFKKRQESMAAYFKGEKRKDGPIPIVGGKPPEKTEQSETMHEFDLPTNSFGAAFSLRDGERFYGLGTASSKRLQLRGHGYRLWAQYRGNFGYNGQGPWEQTEGPVPLLIGTGGWGVFVNTTWVHYYDVGRYETNKAFFWGPGGALDFYLLAGKAMPDLIARYTDITGKPRLMPQFGYGLTYVSQITQNEHEILNDSRLFRDRGIPCDVMGVEPQWMKKNYDSSHEKEWNPDKFYIPSWMGPDSKSGTFIGGLDRTGFKLSLWLVCNDDLTLEAERQAAIREGRSNAVPAAPEAWFKHLQKFVRNGARCFKMDPENLIQEHASRKYYNGRPDLENHNLTQILYHKQMCEGFEEFTQQRAMNHYCAAYAGVQHWGATTMGDNGGGSKALVWMLNYSMAGHMNTSCDMETSPQGIHYGFLQPWSQHNNWASAGQPWFLGKKTEQLFRDYARLRYSLLPYLYSAAHAGHRTSMPILRPMPLAFPEETALADNLNQYMLGESLLVAAFTDRVQLPAGRWIDYWSGKQYTGPMAMRYVCPTNRSGALFIKAGAIIPCWPEMDYSGERTVETIRLEVYPEAKSGFTLYEDDGRSLDYLSGAVAETVIRSEASQGRVTLTVAPRAGRYKGMTSRRGYDIRVHTARPNSVAVNGTPAEWTYDAGAGSVVLGAAEETSGKAQLRVEMEL